MSHILKINKWQRTRVIHFISLMKWHLLIFRCFSTHRDGVCFDHFVRPNKMSNNNNKNRINWSGRIIKTWFSKNIQRAAAVKHYYSFCRIRNLIFGRCCPVATQNDSMRTSCSRRSVYSCQMTVRRWISFCYNIPTSNVWVFERTRERIATVRRWATCGSLIEYAPIQSKSRVCFLWNVRHCKININRPMNIVWENVMQSKMFSANICDGQHSQREQFALTWTFN